jgi:phage baseplate assembly protein W
MNKIIGYTTLGEKHTSRHLTDLDLAKQDLSNHFGIRKGEKWTNPEFGSNLPYYVFLPLDDSTVALIEQDVVDVVSYDPRFALTRREVRVQEDAHFVTVRIELTYLPTTTVTDLELKFDKESAQQVEF